MIIIESFSPDDLEEKNGKRKGGGTMGPQAEVWFKSIDEKIWGIIKTQNQHQSLIQLKAEESELLKLQSEKVDKQELLEMLPNVDVKSQVETCIKLEIVDLSKTMEEMQWAWDHKITKLRSDIDIHRIRKDINTKLDTEDFQQECARTDGSITNIERALIKLSLDLENANGAFNLMFRDVDELKDANWNVLMGKKSVNCLSCGRGDLNFVPAQHEIKGGDGVMYKASKKEHSPLGDRSL